MMFKKYILVFLVFCNLILLGHFAAVGQSKSTIIVPKHFKTVREAVENSKPGDVVLIKAGTYEEKAGLKLKDGLKLIGEGADKTKIKLGPLGIEMATEKSDLNNIAIKDLTLEIEKGSVRTYGVNGLLLQNCIITGKGILAGIEISASKNVQILNCTIADRVLGISVVYGPVELIIRNSIISNNKAGINISQTPIVADTRGMSAEQLEKIYQTPRSDVKLGLFYNDVWNENQNYRNCQPGKFDISKDPKFVGEGDYHLQSNSPCINAGDPDKKYNDPDGTRNDLGALPYGRKK